MQHRLTLDEVADGATRLELDADGSATSPVSLVCVEQMTPQQASAAGHALAAGRHGVLVGVSSTPLTRDPGVSGMLDLFDVVLAPGGVGRWAAGSADDADALVERVSATPHAALVLADVLRVVSRLDVPDGLLVESVAYSALLGGGEFRAWRDGAPVAASSPEEGEPVRLARTGDRLDVVLDRPQRHNAFDRRLRDALVEALAVAEADPTLSEVVLTGAGPSFSSGGDLAEFGSAPDPVVAHLIRSSQSPAAAVHRLGDRVHCVLHGACIGAGIEVPSFAGRVEAAPGTWFQLPELRYGLIPGAGGTVGVSRRIGRWRTAYLALLGDRLDLDTALAWGLVDGRV